LVRSPAFAAFSKKLFSKCITHSVLHRKQTSPVLDQRQNSKSAVGLLLAEDVEAKEGDKADADPAEHNILAQITWVTSWALRGLAAAAPQVNVLTTDTDLTARRLHDTKMEAAAWPLLMRGIGETVLAKAVDLADVATRLSEEWRQ
jgi:3-dehydroquinate synthase